MKPSKKILALLLSLTLLLCLLPATALAAPPSLRERIGLTETEVEAVPEETQEAMESLEAQVQEEEEEELILEPEEAFEETAEEALPPEDEHAHSPDEQSLIPAASCNEAGETCFAEEGELVYNNAGTVYNNGGTVYNNGGLVYNNGGVVYNNGGTVYSNGGVVYNNAGKVYSHGAAVYAFGGDVESSLVAGYCRVTLAGDYSDYVRIEGLEAEPGAEDSLVMAKDGELRLVPLEGFSLLSVTAEGAELSENEDGSFNLTEPGDSLTLALEIQPAAPVFSLAEGTYAQPQSLELSAVEGAQIYYSLDGEQPDADNSQLYEGPIAIEEGLTVTAVAVVDELAPSAAASAAYAVVSLSAPVFDPVEEGYSAPGAQALRVDNPGAVSAHVEEVSLSGENADCFTLSRSSGARISAGDSNERSWTVRPAAKLPAGSYSALLTVRFDSGESAQLELQFEVLPAGEAAEEVPAEESPEEVPAEETALADEAAEDAA